jgi:hypothetical protein
MFYVGSIVVTETVPHSGARASRTVTALLPRRSPFTGIFTGKGELSLGKLAQHLLQL